MPAPRLGSFHDRNLERYIGQLAHLSLVKVPGFLILSPIGVRYKVHEAAED
jgi:hypothetical protein